MDYRKKASILDDDRVEILEEKQNILEKNINISSTALLQHMKTELSNQEISEIEVMIPIVNLVNLVVMECIKSIKISCTQFDVCNNCCFLASIYV